jgi:hypothetical protein
MIKIHSSMATRSGTITDAGFTVQSGTFREIAAGLNAGYDRSALSNGHFCEDRLAIDKS